MEIERIEHRTHIWRWNGAGNASWHMCTIDGAAGEALAGIALMHRLEFGRRRGFGSIKVTAQIGATRWKTSVFPQKGENTFILPIKAAVRNAENIGEDDEVLVRLEPA